MASFLGIEKPQHMGFEDFQNGLVFGIEHGCEAGCPFCLGRKQTEFDVGDEIYVLKGSEAGRQAKIVNVEAASLVYNVQFIDDGRNWQTRLDLRHELVSKLALPPLPRWMLPLSVDDNWAIENAVLGYIVHLGESVLTQINIQEINAIAYTLWRRRLPVSTKEVALMAKAHGLPQSLQSEFQRMLEISWRAMEYAGGRVPIARKRMKPFSKGRYLTANSEKLFKRMRGIG